MKLRPHHLFCLLAYSGKGYSPAFIQACERLQTRFLAGETATLTLKADDLCKACPHMDEHGCCLSPNIQVTADELDQRVLTLLGWRAGDSVTVDLLRRWLTRSPGADLASVCLGCSWRDTADCPRVIRERLVMSAPADDWS